MGRYVPVRRIVREFFPHHAIGSGWNSPTGAGPDPRFWKTREDGNPERYLPDL
jgi:hypothetical protein